MILSIFQRWMFFILEDSERVIYLVVPFRPSILTVTNLTERTRRIDPVSNSIMSQMLSMIGTFLLCAAELLSF